jgi:hypothetical protein
MDYNKFVKIKKNNTHECVVISFTGSEFKKQENYNELYTKLDSSMVTALDFSNKCYNKNTIVIFVDLSGVTVKAMDTGFFKYIIPFFSDKYPDCLEKVILSRIPSFFKACYCIIKYLIDKETRKKVFFEKKNNSNGNICYTNNLEDLDD